MHFGVGGKRIGQGLAPQGGALAGQHQMWLAAQRGPGHQVTSRITHGRYTLEINAVALTNLRKQARGGFAAVAGLVGCMRAIEDGVHTPTHGGQQLVQFAVHGVERRHIKQATAQTRLVGRHHHMPARVIEAGNGLQRTGQGRPFSGRLDEVSAVFVDGAIAVEDDQLHAQATRRDRSATRFMASCRLLSRPWRFKRRSSSSALTITPSKKASTGVRSAARA